jgi:hypothetical protein
MTMGLTNCRIYDPTIAVEGGRPSRGVNFVNS